MRARPAHPPVTAHSRRSSTPAPRAEGIHGGIENRHPEAIAQRKLAEFVRNSPRVVAQAKREAALRGETVQCAGPEEEEMLQGKFAPAQLAGGGPEEEELLQGKFETVQRAGPEEEEMLQGKFAPAQLAGGGPEEEELLQGKFETVQRAGPEEEEMLQGKFAPAQLAGRARGGGTAARQICAGAAQGAQSDREPRENKTGLPDNLKAGVESLSGMSLDHVKVHYNSAQPAQLNALAYAQGSDIHVAPGQEQHLPHEAWHVVQQAQGRVKPTMQMKDGVPVNDDAGLEHEADVMGAKALENSAQRQGAPDERNSLQGKFRLAQRTGPEQEELQMKQTTARRKQASSRGQVAQRTTWLWTNGAWVAQDATHGQAVPARAGKYEGDYEDDGITGAAAAPAITYNYDTHGDKHFKGQDSQWDSAASVVNPMLEGDIQAEERDCRQCRRDQNYDLLSTGDCWCPGRNGRRQERARHQDLYDSGRLQRHRPHDRIPRISVYHLSGGWPEKERRDGKLI